MKNIKSFKNLTILDSYNFSDNGVEVTNSDNNSIDIGNYSDNIKIKTKSMNIDSYENIDQDAECININSNDISIVSGYCKVKVHGSMILDVNKLVIKPNKLLSGYEDPNEINFDNKIEDGTLYFRFREY